MRHPRRHRPPVVVRGPLKPLPPLRHCAHTRPPPLRRGGSRHRSHRPPHWRR
uniref:Uncharacterized protein n=1 Tax=Arundo donax TaxID=35708 RepID=A0A0A9GHY3_ARUDO